MMTHITCEKFVHVHAITDSSARHHMTKYQKSPATFFSPDGILNA